MAVVCAVVHYVRPPRGSAGVSKLAKLVGEVTELEHVVAAPSAAAGGIRSDNVRRLRDQMAVTHGSISLVRRQDGGHKPIKVLGTLPGAHCCAVPLKRLKAVRTALEFHSVEHHACLPL
eukprot:6392305-Prymnesium_polylepis.1